MKKIFLLLLCSYGYIWCDILNDIERNFAKSIANGYVFVIKHENRNFLFNEIEDLCILQINKDFILQRKEDAFVIKVFEGCIVNLKKEFIKSKRKEKN